MDYSLLNGILRIRFAWMQIIKEKSEADKMKFCWCTLQVKNLDESLKFYQEIVKLPLNKRFSAGEGVEIAFLGEGNTQIELVCNSHTGPKGAGEGISLGFEVKSLDDMMNFVHEKGLKIHSGPFQPNPHTKFFFVLDPNGVEIQFVENM
jgi:lactoylglutathione lyase